MSTCSSPESENVALYDKRDFADEIRSCKTEDYPGVSGWAQSNHKHPYKGETRRSESKQKVIRQWKLWSGNAGIQQKLEKANDPSRRVSPTDSLMG